MEIIVHSLNSIKII